MPITRKFLDWSRPALPAVAQHLIAEYGILEQTDLSGVVVVLPGRRACRRLLELLVEQTNSRLNPPTIITEGQFPELLYDPQRPFAGRLVQQLAWGEAVRRLPRGAAERVLRNLPADEDADGWMQIGELLWKLHRELAAEQLDFGDVLTHGARIAGFGERRRWESLHTTQQEYLAILDALELWDRQTARLEAIKRQECRTERDIMMVGTVDLNRTTRAMLDQVADRVTAIIHAPQAMSRRFDEHGCLKPSAWQQVEIDLADEQLRVAEGPAEQADELVRALAAFDGRFRADDITIGLADESLVPQLQRRLKQYDVPARWVVGKTLPQTATLKLLTAAADYLESGRSDHFAALARHPDVGDWLRGQGVDDDWLTQLDNYLTNHLQHKLGFWLGNSDRYSDLRHAFERVTDLLSELSGEKRSLSEFAEPMTHLPLAIFGDRDFDPEFLNDRAEIEAFEALQAALAEHAELPESLAPIVSGAQAIRLTLDLLENEAVPPPRDEAAIELLGWLELSLDDAPAVIVTSFNEQYVPSSIDADLFLPNRLRRELGVLDNDRRYARDSYALTAMQQSRNELTLIAARRDGRGDPLLPSRLALACDAESVARRIESFFKPTTPPRPLPAFTSGSGADDSQPTRPSRLVVPKPAPLAHPMHELSATAFRDYLTCPYRFYLRHVLRLDVLDDTSDELTGRAFGTLTHDVLAEFGSSDVKDSTNADVIEDYLMQRLDEVASRSYGRYRVPAVSVQVEQIRARLQTFARWQAEWAAQGWTIQMVEQPERGQSVHFQVDIERAIQLKGRIDRIDLHTDGRWALLDYKTGDKATDPEKAHRKKDGEWIDLQLPLYRHLAHSLGVEGHIVMGYITLPPDSNDADVLIADWSEQDLKAADEVAMAVARKILDGEFWPLTIPAPRTLADYAAICQDDVFERRLPV